MRIYERKRTASKKFLSGISKKPLLERTDDTVLKNRSNASTIGGGLQGENTIITGTSLFSGEQIMHSSEIGFEDVGLIRGSSVDIDLTKQRDLDPKELGLKLSEQMGPSDHAEEWGFQPYLADADAVQGFIDAGPGARTRALLLFRSIDKVGLQHCLIPPKDMPRQQAWDHLKELKRGFRTKNIDPYGKQVIFTSARDQEQAYSVLTGIPYDNYFLEVNDAKGTFNIQFNPSKIVLFTKQDWDAFDKFYARPKLTSSGEDKDNHDDARFLKEPIDVRAEIPKAMRDAQDRAKQVTLFVLKESGLDWTGWTLKISTTLVEYFEDYLVHQPQKFFYQMQHPVIAFQKEFCKLTRISNAEYHTETLRMYSGNQKACGRELYFAVSCVEKQNPVYGVGIIRVENRVHPGRRRGLDIDPTLFPDLNTQAALVPLSLEHIFVNQVRQFFKGIERQTRVQNFLSGRKLDLSEEDFLVLKENLKNSDLPFSREGLVKCTLQTAKPKRKREYPRYYVQATADLQSYQLRMREADFGMFAALFRKIESVQAEAYSRAHHPGEVLARDYCRGIKPKVLAKKLGWPEERVHNLIDGNIGVTADLARDLERVLAQSAERWLTLQNMWDLKQSFERSHSE